MYAKQIIQHFPGHFKDVPKQEMRVQLHIFEKAANVEDPANASPPATAAQARALIGDLRFPEQRAILGMWTTTARFVETTQWEVTFFPRTQLVCVTNHWHKTDPTGRIKLHRWFQCASIEEARMYQPVKGLTSDRVRAFIRQKFEELGCHSFRKGAIQELQRRGFEHAEMGLLAAHKGPGRSQQDYQAITPGDPLVQHMVEMTEFLQQRVGFTPGRLQAPRRH